jgi:hypothetical protein
MTDMGMYRFYLNGNKIQAHQRQCKHEIEGRLRSTAKAFESGSLAHFAHPGFARLGTQRQTNLLRAPVPLNCCLRLIWINRMGRGG